MKKSLLFASMGLLSLSVMAQGIDPATYTKKEGYELKNLWLMGCGETQVGANEWAALADHFANPAKATSAARLGDKIYISCNQSWGVGEGGEKIMTDDHHLVVLDAATGKFIKEIPLTINGQPSTGLIQANCLNTDDFGHLWITPYVAPMYLIDEATGEVKTKPLPLYQVNPETGEMTLINSFVLDDIDGPSVSVGNSRVDFCAVTGDITREKARCAFMAVVNDVAAVCAWHSEQGSDEWDIDISEDAEYCVILAEQTYPADQTAWNYSPMASFVKDDEFSGKNFYIDGHTTQPVLYEKSGEMTENLASHTPAKEATPEEDPWVGFMPESQPNGVLQFALGNDNFLIYALTVGGTSWTNVGQFAILKLDANGCLADATPLWTAPEGTLGQANSKGDGRFYHSISVSPEMKDANGKKAVEIFVYKECAGAACYLLAEEGYVSGVADAVADLEANGPVKFFNLNGVEVNGNNLTAGVYVTLQGGVAKKVLVK